MPNTVEWENTSANWQLEKDRQNIIWLTLNAQKTTVNILDTHLLNELQAVLEYISTLNPKGLIIQSGKSSGFIAGADIQQIKNIEDTEDALQLILQGQRVFA